jgi:hypothetical protein
MTKNLCSGTYSINSYFIAQAVISVVVEAVKSVFGRLEHTLL